MQQTNVVPCFLCVFTLMQNFVITALVAQSSPFSWKAELALNDGLHLRKLYLTVGYHKCRRYTLHENAIFDNWVRIALLFVILDFSWKWCRSSAVARSLPLGFYQCWNIINCKDSSDTFKSCSYRVWWNFVAASSTLIYTTVFQIASTMG